MTRPNRATHAALPLTHDTSLPRGAEARGDDRTRCAIAAYVAYTADPVFEPPPTLAEVWLIAVYLQDYICSPIFPYAGKELRDLQRRVEHIRTLNDLADWLWDCRAIGIEPL